MTDTKRQLSSTFSAALLLSFAIAFTAALSIVQIAYQVSNSLDNLVLASLKPTLSLAQAIPQGILSGSSPSEDILIEWKILHANSASQNINQAIAESTNNYQPSTINFPESIAPQDLDLTDFSLRDLKDLAKLRGLPGYSRMSKAALLKAL